MLIPKSIAVLSRNMRMIPKRASLIRDVEVIPTSKFISGKPYKGSRLTETIRLE